jgi:hypothetical protein
MITHSKLSDINLNTPEGQLLMSAVAILTSIDHKHISSNKWGGNLHPDKCVKQISDLANKIYYEEEWEKEMQRIKRDNKINQIIKKDNEPK